MPRVAFSTENKVVTTNYEYPKLKLVQNERARILTGLEDPYFEYVHNLQKPQIINGTAQTQEVLNDRTKQKSIQNVMEFISRPICLGDPTVMEDKGADVKNCPMCKLAKEHPDMAKPAQRRYAMHVIKYRTKGGTFDLVKPYGIDLQVWSFTDTIFNKLIEFKETWGDLRKHDLLLGPCTNPNFQKFDISIAPNALWLTSPDWKKQTWESFQENQIPDLSIACGSNKQKQWIEEDVATILEAWGEAQGSTIAEDDDVDLDADLGSLLDKSPKKDAEGWALPDDLDAEPDAEDIDLSDLDGLSNDLVANSAEEAEAAVDADPPVKKATTRKPAAKKAPAPEPEDDGVPDIEPDEPAEGDDPDNFDDLLKDL